MASHSHSSFTQPWSSMAGMQRHTYLIYWSRCKGYWCQYPCAIFNYCIHADVMLYGYHSRGSDLFMFTSRHWIWGSYVRMIGLSKVCCSGRVPEIVTQPMVALAACWHCFPATTVNSHLYYILIDLRSSTIAVCWLVAKWWYFVIVTLALTTWVGRVCSSC